MEINNIILQTNQVNNTSRAPARSELSPDVTGSNASTPASSLSRPASSEAQTMSISSDINYIQQKLDAALINYPPFFPVGHPQRIDLIKGLKGIQEKIEKSAVPTDVKKGVSDIKLNDNASDSDISAALNTLIHVKDTVIQNNADKKPGTVVNLKI